MTSLFSWDCPSLLRLNHLTLHSTFPSPITQPCDLPPRTQQWHRRQAHPSSHQDNTPFLSVVYQDTIYNWWSQCWNAVLHCPTARGTRRDEVEPCLSLNGWECCDYLIVFEVINDSYRVARNFPTSMNSNLCRKGLLSHAAFSLLSMLKWVIWSVHCLLNKCLKNITYVIGNKVTFSWLMAGFHMVFCNMLQDICLLAVNIVFMLLSAWMMLVASIFSLA